MLGDYPGEMRFLTGPLQSEQVAVTYRRMPAGTGGKGSYGHRHRTQEEVYMVTSGLLVFKLGDDIVEVPRATRSGSRPRSRVRCGTTARSTPSC